MTHLTSADFSAKIESGYTFVDFWAEWCGPCKMIAPVFEQLSEEWKDKVTFAKLDADAHGDVAMKYHVQGIPTLILFKDGEEKNRIVGAVPKVALEDFLKDNVK